MRAMLSDGGRIPATLKPHLYESDRRWLALTAEDEARAVMAPEGSGGRFEVGVMDIPAGVVWFEGHGGEPFHGANGYMTADARALVEALAAFVGGA